MVSRPPAEPGPLGDYVEQMLPDLYGAFWMRRRIAEEVTGHLRDAVERLQTRGLSLEQAERQAIEHFGPPSLVARTFAQTKGIGVTTNFTRWSGLALILGVAVVAVAFAWQALSESFEHTVFAPIGFSGLALVGVGLAGIYLRLRGQLGRVARVGARLLFVGVPGVFISGAFWFAPGYVVFAACAAAGFLAYALAMYRSNTLPRPAVALVLFGFLGAGTIGAIGTWAGRDTSNAATFGQILVAIGLAWVGLYLWHEVVEVSGADARGVLA